MRKKYIVSFCVAGALFIAALCFLSRLVEPKYVSLAREGNLISEYYRETDAGRSHDVIFIGDCEAYSSFVPPILYEKYGIRSFVRGSPSQSMAQSYYLLCETLKYEKPRAVVLSVYAMCRYDEPREAYNRMTLDGMRLSSDKLAAVRESTREDESIASYLLPLLRFHSRIFELGEEDIRYLLSRPAVSHNGYFLVRETVGADGGIAAEESGEPLPQKSFDYLDRMRESCLESGVELILVKAPTSSWRYPWYENWDAEIASYAEENGLLYYNLIENADEIGLDMMNDTYDGGLHLNVWGAEKTTVYFGAILSDSFGLEPREEEAWERKVREYYEQRG